MRILEEVIVVDEQGAEVRRFVRECDPRNYVWTNVPRDAESITRRRRLTESEAAQVLALD